VTEREMIEWFAGRMQAKLDARRDKLDGGQLPQVGRSFEWFTEKLATEYVELFDALRDADVLLDVTAPPANPPSTDQLAAIIDECADVANYAMQIADKARRVGVS